MKGIITTQQIPETWDELCDKAHNYLGYILNIKDEDGFDSLVKKGLWSFNIEGDMQAYINKKVYIIGKLKDYVENRCGKFSDCFDNAYFNCTPLTQEQIKVLGLEE